MIRRDHGLAIPHLPAVRSPLVPAVTHSIKITHVTGREMCTQDSVVINVFLRYQNHEKSEILGKILTFLKIKIQVSGKFLVPSRDPRDNKRPRKWTFQN